MSNFLTGLELQGFKSFANKTKFDFNSRLVGIVGPNGSGKSNVIDAFRWILGERDAKHLRGGVLSNLIFAGTPKKSAASLAVASLVFNNQNGLFPVPAAEVTLTRRVDRSGASQFFINNQEIKLKDLVPILARLRLGHRGLNIIGQGEADIFVKINAQERRLLIEEILGLKEYRLKKKTAESRLNRSQINIENLRSKIEEIAPHLRFLTRQKNKWAKRQEVAAELKKLVSVYFSYHYPQISRQMAQIKSRIEVLAEKQKAKEKEVSAVSRELEQINRQPQMTDELLDFKKKIDGLVNQKTEINRQIAKLEIKSEFQAEALVGPDAKRAVSLIKEFLAEIKAVFPQKPKESLQIIGGWIKKFGEFLNPPQKVSPAADKFKRELEVLRQKIGEIDNQIAELRDKESALIKSQTQDNKAFRDKMYLLEEKKSELGRIKEDLNRQRLEMEKLKFRQEELESRWQLLGFSVPDLKSLAFQDHQEDWFSVNKKIEKLRMEMTAIGEIDEAIIKEAEEVEVRFNKMKTELLDLEKTAADLKQLIRDLESRIQKEFRSKFSAINQAFDHYFKLMFGGGSAQLKLAKKEAARPEEEPAAEAKESAGEEEGPAGVEIRLNVPKKKITGLEMLSGGEKSLVSMAALFALISVSPPPFLVLDEIDAALDEYNARRFSDLIKEFSRQTQFVIVTHNRVTMESCDILYGITMGDDGVSMLLSVKLTEAEELSAQDKHSNKQ